MHMTNEELKQLKSEYENLNNKLKELSEDELKIVIGGNNEDNKPNLNSSPISTVNKSKYKSDTDMCRCNVCGNIYPVITNSFFKDTIFASYSCPSCGALDYEVIG